MKKNKLTAVILLVGIVWSLPSPVLANVDFSSRLTELETLMNECEVRNIPTDYEMINYATIERFEDYINEDIQNGESYVDFNISRIDNLYNEAKENLIGYLDGSKAPKSIERSDIDTITTRGSAIYNGMKPVFSIGYGHFNQVVDDLPNFEKFGTNNIQIEIGPTEFSAAKVEYIKNTLDMALENNIGVTLLLSPHYFPTDLRDDIYADTGAFIKYNINAKEAREVIENYLRNLMPYLQDKPALVSICLSNEPVFDTRNFKEFYNPLFRDYLKDIHGSIEILNKRYKTTYQGFSDITMPNDINSANPICYDWIEFNDKNFAEWHEWMAGIIREYLPDTPLHSKVMGYFLPGTESDKSSLEKGTDIELFGEFCDWSGNDTWNWYNSSSMYYTYMFYYDYQHSAVGKPVYNSEDHIIEDNSLGFDDKQRAHVRNSLWMGAIHGRNMSTIWVWDRDNSSNSTSDFHNSVLYRPDVVAEIGKTNLDLSRLSYQVSRLQQSAPECAIFYSKPSRLYSTTHSKALYKAYQDCINNGVKVGVVSDKSIDKLSHYKTLVIPEAVNCKAETLVAVENFIKNGGKVIYSGNVFSLDEYQNTLDNSYILNKGYSYVENFMKHFNPRVTLVDESTGEAPVDLDWSYNVTGSSVLINLTNLDYDSEKKISLYLDGKKLTGMTELIKGEKEAEIVMLSGYTPKLLEYNLPDDGISKIKNLSVAGNVLFWEHSGNYTGADIFFLNKNGNIYHVGESESNKYEFAENGTYIVRPFFGTDEELITISETKPFSITVDEFQYMNKSISVEVSLKNSTLEYSGGTVYFNVYDTNDSVIKYAYNTITTLGEGTDKFKLSIPVSDDASWVEVGIWDSTSTKNLFSNVERINLK